MRGIRLSTLMLNVVIVALSLSLLVQHYRAQRRIAEAERRIAEMDASPTLVWQLISEKRITDREIARLKRRVEELGGTPNSPDAAEKDRSKISAKVNR